MLVSVLIVFYFNLLQYLTRNQARYISINLKQHTRHIISMQLGKELIDFFDQHNVYDVCTKNKLYF